MLLTALPPYRLTAQSRHIDVTTYRFLIDLPDTGNNIRGMATVLFRSLPRYDDTLRLDLVNMTVDKVFNIETIERLPFVHADGVLKIVTGRTRGVVIEYHGAPTDGLIYDTANARGRRSFFADNWPNRARFWLPTNDHPSDKAKVAWSVRAPAGMQVVMNSSDCRAGTRRPSRMRPIAQCAESAPIPTYTMVIGATVMSVNHRRPAVNGTASIPIEIWTYPEDSAFADSVPFRRATEIVEAMVRIVGPFPYSRLAHVQSSTRYGGMENASAIFYSENSYVRRTMGEGVVRHETAHQWFGDAVTEADWHHVWLSESFATYFDAVLAGALDGDTARIRVMAGNRRTYTASNVVNAPIIDTTITDPNDVLNANTYPKGAWVLHMLQHTVGEPAFFAGVREFYRAYRDSSVLTAQFQRTMETASRMRLDWFFRQWLWQPGYPQLEARIADGRLLVRQVQPEPWGSFRIDGLPVSLSGGTCGRISIRLAANRDEQRFPLPPCGATAAVLDPDSEWLLRQNP